MSLTHKVYNWISYSPKRTTTIIVVLFLAAVFMLLFVGCAHRQPQIKEVIREVKVESNLEAKNCIPRTMVVLMAELPDTSMEAGISEIGCRCNIYYKDRILVDLKPLDPSYCQ